MEGRKQAELAFKSANAMHYSGLQIPILQGLEQVGLVGTINIAR
jgi:hypothetical protein